MPLTISRPSAAKLIGISLDAITKKTESGEIAVQMQGSRSKVPVGELARIGKVTIAELAERYDAMFSDDAA